MQQKGDTAITSKRIALKWSDTLKYPDFEIQGPIAKRIDESSMVYAGFLADEPLLGNSEIPYDWSIRIKCKKGRMFVGICLENVAKKDEFQAGKWDDPGHGYYLLRDDGWVYSSSDGSLNDKKKYPFQEFKEGDLISLTYNPFEGTLDFSPNRASHFFMKVTPAPEGDTYRPCVFSSETGDEVELVGKK